MANQKTFTYNTSSFIPGTEQIGDLAIGITLQDYASGIGNTRWWGGPDETNRYIIAKDVPNSNHPTPLGNVGNVRFWSSNENDTDFIFRVSTLPERSGQPSFTTTTQCLNFLSESGYWTNYGEGDPLTLYSQSAWRMHNDNNTNVGSVPTLYSSTRGQLIGRPIPGLAPGRQPYLISSSQLPSGIYEYIAYNTPSDPYTNDYFVQDETGSFNGNFYTELASATNSEYLFGFKKPYASFTNNYGLVKWDLSDNGRILEQIKFGYDQLINFAWNSLSDKVYVTGRFEEYSGGPLSYYTKIFSGSDFSAPTESIENSSYLITYSSTDDSGNVLAIQTGTNNKWYLISGSEFYHTGSTTIRATTNGFNPGQILTHQWAYSETSEKFYVTTISESNGSPLFETSKLVVIDPNNFSKKEIVYGGNDTIRDNSGGYCVWDANRNCIWACSVDYKLYAFECGGDTLVKSNISLDGGGSFYGSMTIDTDNDYLLYGDLVIPLGPIWPI
jgi:hypothetical protein